MILKVIQLTKTKQQQQWTRDSNNHAGDGNK